MQMYGTCTWFALNSALFGLVVEWPLYKPRIAFLTISGYSPWLAISCQNQVEMCKIASWVDGSIQREKRDGGAELP